jgi:hypothetical protein
METRLFIGGRPTAELIRRCELIECNVTTIVEKNVEDLRDFGLRQGNLPISDMARLMFDEFKEVRHVKSHIAVVLDQRISNISRFISGLRRGGGENGRPRLLSREEEDQVLRYIRDYQCSGHCITFSQATAFINNHIY